MLCGNGGKFKNFQCVLRALWGNFKIQGQNIHPWKLYSHAHYLPLFEKEKDISILSNSVLWRLLPKIHHQILEGYEIFIQNEVFNIKCKIYVHKNVGIIQPTHWNKFSKFEQYTLVIQTGRIRRGIQPPRTFYGQKTKKCEKPGFWGIFSNSSKTVKSIVLIFWHKRPLTNTKRLGEKFFWKLASFLRKH